MRGTVNFTLMALALFGVACAAMALAAYFAVTGEYREAGEAGLILVSAAAATYQLIQDMDAQG